MWWLPLRLRNHLRVAGYAGCDTADVEFVQKKLKKTGSVEDAGFFEGVEGAIFGDGAQGFAGDFHADVAAAATVELGHPDALFLEVGVDSAVHRLGHVAADTALFLGKTGAVNAATLVGHGEGDVADSGHSN